MTPCLFRQRRGGIKSSNLTWSAVAKIIISESVTHRIWASIFDSVPRLMSHPCRAHLAASISWVSACWYRILRTCGPTMFCFVAIAPISELDCSEEQALNCSDLGAV